MIEIMADMALTDSYWDCECERDFIRPAASARCGKCGATREESPDSRLDEVIAALVVKWDFRALNGNADIARYLRLALGLSKTAPIGPDEMRRFVWDPDAVAARTSSADRGLIMRL